MIRQSRLSSNPGLIPPYTQPTIMNVSSRVTSQQVVQSLSDSSQLVQQAAERPLASIVCPGCEIRCDECCSSDEDVCMDDACRQPVAVCTDECKIVECNDACEDACFDSCQSGWCAQPQCDAWGNTWPCEACPPQVICCDGQTDFCTGEPCPSLSHSQIMPPSQKRPLLPAPAQPQFTDQQYFQALAAQYHQQGMSPNINPFLPQPPQFMHPSFAGMGPPPTYSHPPSRTPSLASSLSAHNSPMPDSFGLESSLPFVCLWSNCSLSFHSLEQLKAHVDQHHLHLPGVPCAHVPSPHMQQALANPLSFYGLEHMEANECLWGNCNEALPPDMQPGSLASALALGEHLLQDHLNTDELDLTNFGAGSSMNGFGSGMMPRGGYQDSGRAPPDLSNASSIRTSPTSSGDDHICEWEGCGHAFPSSADLMQHITSVHVGSGKNEYWCNWIGCDRHTERRAFSSKQKILRHVQSHIGYRPYECDVCHEFFSEPATLQQHKRRHTKEKPFLCDEPGCGKSFAIAGALTIHKRTHNGEKPFKCPNCDRAFSESSNYTKHLRTHTGVKPYACLAHGCGKTFSRPDQLSRHAHTHEKAAMNDGRGSEETDEYDE